jgi:mycothiol system anti-sigma-R factor
MADVDGHGGHDEDVDCTEAVERLYWFLDGELTVERRMMIQRHLDDCHDCIEAYEFEAELRMAISRGCRDSVPESLRDRIAQALAQERGPSGI